MLRLSVAFMMLLPLACTPGDGEDDMGSDTTGATIDVPTEGTELAEWLAAETYSNWDAESAIHDPMGTSPHGRVRTYFNDVLSASFDAGNATHTVGSATVKELYDAMDTRIGWAVAVKVAEGDAPESWYWYLETGGSVTANSNGAGACDGCHSAGTDRILTVYPLE